MGVDDHGAPSSDDRRHRARPGQQRLELRRWSGLVPRPLAALGLIGGPLVCASGTAVLFGLVEQGSAAQTIAVIPEFFWELLLGIYLTVKGFRPTAAASEPARTATTEALSAA